MKKFFQKLRYKLAKLIAGDIYVLTKWTRVEDGPPDPQVDVFVAIRYGEDRYPSEVKAAFLNAACGWRTADERCDPVETRFNRRKVTHWMPMPKPPKEG